MINFDNLAEFDVNDIINIMLTLLFNYLSTPFLFTNETAYFIMEM